MSRFLALAMLTIVTVSSIGCACGPLRRTICQGYEARCNACNVCPPCDGVIDSGCSSCAGGGVISGPGVIVGPSTGTVPGTIPGPVIGN